MKNRFLQKQLLSRAASKFGRLIVLTGARQTGKTTLVGRCFADYDYLSMDDPVTRPQYTALSAAQWKVRFPRAVVDEVQKTPSLIETVKAVHDANNETRYVLTGSSQILLLDQVRESLAGRVSVLELYPLTFPEIRTRKWEDRISESRLIDWLRNRDIGLIRDGMPQSESNYAHNAEILRRYLAYGAMPALWDESITAEDKDEWLRNYIKTYLQRDLRDLGNVRELEPFVLAQKATAQHSGCLLNYSNLANLAGITPKTAKRFVGYLELSYQAVLLRPWFRNKNKRLSKSPKIHFLDPGILRAVLSRKGELTGNEFETAVFAEIYKQIRTSRLDVDVFHLRTSDGREVDLLIETESGFIPIEIKMTANVVASDGRNLRELEHILDKPVIHSLIVSNDQRIRTFGDNITAVPAAWLLGSV